MAMQRTTTIPRNELGKLTREPRLQKQLEDMSKAVAQDIPDAVEEALDKANEALDLAQNTKEQAFLTAAPSVSLPNSRRLTVGQGLATSDGGSGGEFRLDLQSFLQALSLLTGNGIVVKTVAGAQLRAIEAGSARIEVMNGDGTTGNPAIDIDEPSLNLGNMGGVVGVDHGGTGVTVFSAFSAHKGGTNQAIPDSVFTVVTFGTEAFDIGGDFSGNAWTPPAGRPVTISGTVSVLMPAGGAVVLSVFKNGVEFKRGDQTATAVGATGVSVTCMDIPSGTDAYTLRLFQSSGASADVQGLATLTHFCGSMA